MISMYGQIAQRCTKMVSDSTMIPSCAWIMFIYRQLGLTFLHQHNCYMSRPIYYEGLKFSSSNNNNDNKNNNLYKK